MWTSICGESLIKANRAVLEFIKLSFSLNIPFDLYDADGCGLHSGARRSVVLYSLNSLSTMVNAVGESRLARQSRCHAGLLPTQF